MKYVKTVNKNIMAMHKYKNTKQETCPLRADCYLCVLTSLMVENLELK